MIMELSSASVCPAKFPNGVLYFYNISIDNNVLFVYRSFINFAGYLT